MPLYEYACQKCDCSFELLIRGSEAARCPHCESGELEKLLSVPAAHSAGGSTNLPISSPVPDT